MQAAIRVDCQVFAYRLIPARRLCSFYNCSACACLTVGSGDALVATSRAVCGFEEAYTLKASYIFT